MLLGHGTQIARYYKYMSIPTSYKHSKSLKHKQNEKSKQTDQHLIPTTSLSSLRKWALLFTYLRDFDMSV